ncbi:hypothetical protein PRIPAC_96521 [Pristionchus pacificus]|uniref:Uncharacterized protein n=1 Tax=Pristionchus pacificus TaxID=54126 RepID=A0A2A6B2K9_PRIPA|nr:hypothetical protein PRIPAC_96521 [Pristionchus pacificus]|eukprot:PDM60102.1 hypothetical protein PRIPAC_49388 [Pristionchus pacificus]
MNYWIIFLSLISLLTAQTLNSETLRSINLPDGMRRISLRDFTESIETVPHVVAKRCRWKLCGTGRKFRLN